MDAQKKLRDLPNDIANAAASQVSAMAVIADWHLVTLYDQLVSTTTTTTQNCLHYWNLAICSEMFSRMDQPRSVCYETCRAVKTHCTAQFVTDKCSDVLKAGPFAGCVDYSILTCNASCSADEFSAPPPLPHHQNILGVPTPRQYTIPAQRAHHLRIHDDDDDGDGEHSSHEQHHNHKGDSSRLAPTCETLIVVTIVYFLSIFGQRRE